MRKVDDGNISSEALSVVISGKVTTKQNVFQIVEKVNKVIQDSGEQIVYERQTEDGGNSGYTLVKKPKP